MLNTSKKYNAYNAYYKKAKKEVLNNNYELAIEYYKKILQIKKNDIICLNELCNLYENLNRNYEAIECLKQQILFETNLGKKLILLNQIGVNYSNLKEYTNAIEWFDKVIQIKNDLPEVYNNIAFCYFQLKNFKSTEINYYNSLRLVKDNKLYWSLGDLYFWIKKYDLSIKCYKKVDNFQNNSIVKYNCCFPYLAQKKFIEGFNLYENRLETNDICEQTKLKKRLDIPQIEYWDGEKPCNSLLIVYEQGIGDNIQYYRFIIELSELHPNMKIYYFCKDVVQYIFKEYDNIHIIKDVVFTDYDYKIYIMSLPFILKLDAIKPNLTNYINIDNNKVDYWKNELSHLKKYRVGITYNGLLSSVIDKNIPLSEFTLLFDSNVELICIHKLNEIKDEYKDIFKDKITFLDIDKEVPFQDTISILQNIDLLITIDTFIVHLAGILNVKTWLLLGYVSDWRWFDDDSICHWYNSVELMRMKENKELKYILPEVKEKLEKIL
jgi:tetratricopeptide (TPR) repeat protein